MGKRILSGGFTEGKMHQWSISIFRKMAKELLTIHVTKVFICIMV
jgi:hypothetical protein